MVKLQLIDIKHHFRVALDARDKLCDNWSRCLADNCQVQLACFLSSCWPAWLVLPLPQLPPPRGFFEDLGKSSRVCIECLHSSKVCHNLTCTRMCRHRMECSGSNVVAMPNYFSQCTCICGISSPPCLLLYIHSGSVFLCAFACTLLLYASSQLAIISHYWCVKTNSANSLLRLHCFALMPPCQLLTNNWARSLKHCHQEEVISQPAIVSDSCKFTNKCPPVDIFLQSCQSP